MGQQPAAPRGPATPPPAAEPPSLVKDVKTGGFYVWALVSLIGGTSLNAVLVEAAQGRELDVEKATAIWKLFWASLPLTAGAAVLLFLLVRGWFNDKGIVAFGWAAALLLGTNLWAGALGLTSAVATAGSGPESSTPPGLLLWVLGLYLQGYGLQLFLQSAVIAGALAALAHRHLPRDLT